MSKPGRTAIIAKPTQRNNSLNDVSTGRYDIDTDSGLLRQARQCPSPNQDERPTGAEPNLVVVHGISLPPGKFGGPEVEQFFMNQLNWDAHPYFAALRDVQVSAHIFIRRDGEVVQFVPFGRRAWHAGESAFRGVSCCNDYSIGIELEGEDDTEYTDQQYIVLAAIVVSLASVYPGLDARRIAGHCDIAPGRKLDPGPAFDWLRLYDGIAGHPSGAA